MAIGVAFALRILIPYGMDPAIFVAFDDEEWPIQTSYVREMLGDVETNPRFAHDGKYFFAQANDPWYLEPERHAAVLDRPIYRGQRMLFPTIASGFGFFPPGAIVWSMLVTNLLALAIGAVLAAKLAAFWGLSPWMGIWVPLNIGLLFELEIGGAGIVAYACCLGAVFALARQRTWLASLLFAAAALSRETMVAFTVGVLALWWLERRRFLWRILITPLAAMAVWQVYLRFRLIGIAGVGGGWDAFAAPFIGMVEAFRFWTTDAGNLFVNVALLLIVLAFIPLTLRSRLPIAWGALPFVLIAPILSANVWWETRDFARALAPVFTAVPFLVALPDRLDLRHHADIPTKELS
jgi:hypothetical protein